MSTTYLSPGFFVTLSDQRQVIHLPLMPTRQRRATPARLAVIDVFNRGYTGDHTDLILDIVDRFDVRRGAIRDFINSLQEAGYLTDTAPADHFEGEPASTTGTVGSDEKCAAAGQIEGLVENVREDWRLRHVGRSDGQCTLAALRVGSDLDL